MKSRDTTIQIQQSTGDGQRTRTGGQKQQICFNRCIGILHMKSFLVPQSRLLWFKKKEIQSTINQPNGEENQDLVNIMLC